MDRAAAAKLWRQAQVSPEEQEFRAWLRKCAGIMEGWSSNEVAHMAIMAGFDRELVVRVLSDFKAAMIPGAASLENRAALKEYDRDHAIAQFLRMRDDLEKPKPFDLKPSWDAVIRFQTEGVEFAEAA